MVQPSFLLRKVYKVSCSKSITLRIVACPGSCLRASWSLNAIHPRSRGRERMYYSRMWLSEEGWVGFDITAMTFLFPIQIHCTGSERRTKFDHFAEISKPLSFKIGVPTSRFGSTLVIRSGPLFEKRSSRTNRPFSRLAGNRFGLHYGFAPVHGAQFVLPSIFTSRGLLE